MLAYFLTGPFMYIAVAVFLAVTISKVRGYQQMPRHLRWDLYPIPHLGQAGSKYQQVDFHTKPPVFSKIDEGKFLGMEMIFIKKAFVNNRKLWTGSWPMHMGLYLGMAWLGLIVAGAVLEIAGVPIAKAQSMTLGWLVGQVTVMVGAAAFGAGLFGTLITLWHRYTDSELRYMADLVTFYNLYLLVAVFGSALYAFLTVDSSFELIRGQVKGLLTFSGATVQAWPVVLEMTFFGIFICYLPFSRMMHFAAKYFFYHNIMWDDEAMKPGSDLEKDITSYLGYQLRWGASHVNTGDSWAGQAVPKEEDKGGQKP